MILTFGVWQEPHRGGAIFVGPGHRVSWSPTGQLTYGLRYAVRWEVAAHPWDGWPLNRALKWRKFMPRAPRKAPPSRRGTYAR